MNIRQISNPVIPAEVKRTDESKRLQAGESHQDRDADGRREHGEGRELDKSPLTKDEMEKAKKYFDNLASLKANGLTVEVVESSAELKLFLVKDPQGQVVRRIPEHEMRILIQDKDRKSGQLFDRAG